VAGISGDAAICGELQLVKTDASRIMIMKRRIVSSPHQKTDIIPGLITALPAVHP
jgi:hypothetical protein